MLTNSYQFFTLVSTLKPKNEKVYISIQFIFNEPQIRRLQQREIWYVWWQWFPFLTGYAEVFIYSCCYGLRYLYLEVTGSQSKMKDISLFGSHVQSLCSVLSIHLPWQPGIVIAFHLVSCNRVIEEINFFAGNGKSRVSVNICSNGSPNSSF